MVLCSGKAIVSQLESATRSLELVSPYVRGSAIEEVLARSPARRKRLVARYRPFDILSGTTDLAALARLRHTVEIRFLEDVHARFYIADGKWAYVGSSLLTRSGLDDSGADVGVALTSDADLRLLYVQFAQLWTQAVELTPAQWTLALHASDHALEIVETTRRTHHEAERALSRFVNVPRLRHAQRARPLAVEPRRHTPEFVRRRLESWAGSANAARAVAELLAWSIEQIPSASESAAWTVLLDAHHLRLKLGLPEIVHLEEAEDGGVLSVMGLAAKLSEADRAALKAVRATVTPSPYASATGLSRDAVRIGNVPLRELGRVVEILKPGLAAYVALHWSQAPTMAQRAFAPAVLEYLEDELDRTLPWPKDRRAVVGVTGT